MPLVYIVEDDEDIRELSVYALQSGGFDCEGYESAADFLEALERKRPDLALLDIMLPGEDGLSLLKRLRGNKRYIDCIFLCPFISIEAITDSSSTGSPSHSDSL